MEEKTDQMIIRLLMDSLFQNFKSENTVVKEGLRNFWSEIKALLNGTVQQESIFKQTRPLDAFLTLFNSKLSLEVTSRCEQIRKKARYYLVPTGISSTAADASKKRPSTDISASAKTGNDLNFQKKKAENANKNNFNSFNDIICDACGRKGHHKKDCYFREHPDANHERCCWRRSTNGKLWHARGEVELPPNLTLAGGTFKSTLFPSDGKPSKRSKRGIHLYVI